MNYFDRAYALKDETVAHRRWFHRNAEVGLQMPKAQAYILAELEKLGIDAKPCGHGVSAILGKAGKTILLRADMDALPMPELSGEAFACPTGTEAHTCGHDFHAAMLLSAAKILKEMEPQLEGTVKLMFQPAEETFEGAKDMIAAGLLEDPKPDAALAFHVTPGQAPAGVYVYNNTGTMMYSVDGFQITVKGRGSHGAYPHVSIDPINIAAHIYLALQSLIAREVDPAKANLLTIGKFSAGTAPNIIPETAELQGTIRSNDKDSRQLLVRRMREIAEKTAESFGGTAQIEALSEVPPLICDPAVTTELAKYLGEIPGLTGVSGMSASASEDFAVVADQIPSAMFYLTAGFPDERGAYTAHNPKVRFNEDVCPIGVCGYVHCAVQWLKEHK